MVNDPHKPMLKIFPHTPTALLFGPAAPGFRDSPRSSLGPPKRFQPSRRPCRVPQGKVGKLTSEHEGPHGSMGIYEWGGGEQKKSLEIGLYNPLVVLGKVYS